MTWFRNSKHTAKKDEEVFRSELVVKIRKLLRIFAVALLRADHEGRWWIVEEFGDQ